MTVFSRNKSRDIIIRPMTENDIEDVRLVSQIAWTDLATRDVGRKVKYPKRPAKLISAYMWREPSGCLVVENEGDIIGSAFCHVWGKVGWIGPLEVLPNHQDRGIGKSLLTQCEAYLDSKGCEVIGLETMPHLAKNLHFYLTSGYSSRDLTVIVEKALDYGTLEAINDVHLVDQSNISSVLPEIASLSSKVNARLDYTREWEMVIRKELGVGLIQRQNSKIEGAALLHTYHRAEDGDYASIKMMAADPDGIDPIGTLNNLLGRAESLCQSLGKNRMMTRFSVESNVLYNIMSARGYLLKGTNVRMIKRGDYKESGRLNLTSWAG